MDWQIIGLCAGLFAFFLWQTRLSRVLEENKETVEALKDRIAELEKDIETQQDTILAQSAGACRKLC